MIPDYIREQVLNAKPPDGCCVPGGSVPAVAEGHFTFARAATVGINPHGSWNRKDYLPKECLTLDRDDLDEQFLNRVREEKTRYFERNTHRYFTMLKPILNACGVTYGGKYGADRPDLACSLDLVQWPTDPLWRRTASSSNWWRISAWTSRCPRTCCEKTLKPAQLRPRIDYLQVAYRVRERRACGVLALSRGSHRYRSVADEQAVLRMRLRTWPRPWDTGRRGDEVDPKNWTGG